MIFYPSTKFVRSRTMSRPEPKACFQAILSLICAVLLVGCQTGEPPLTRSVTTLVFACNPGDVGSYQAVASAFAQSNPGVQVDVVAFDALPGDSPATGVAPLERSRRAAQQADAFIAHGLTTELGSAGVLRDLSPLLAQSTEFKTDDFGAELLSFFQGENRTWGVPAGVYPFVLVLRPADLEAAGAVEPSAAWTWEDLRALANRLTRRNGAQVERYGLADYQVNGLRALLTARNIARPSGSGAGGPVALDDARVVEAVRWYSNLALVDQSMPAPAAGMQVDSWGAFRRGDAAMAVIGLTDWVSLTPAERTGMKVVALPGATPVEPYGYFISAASPHPEIAWNFIWFAARQVTPSNALPANAQLVGSVSGFDADAEDLWRHALANPTLPLRPSAIEGGLREITRRALAGDAVEAAARMAQAEAPAAGPVTPERPVATRAVAATPAAGATIKFLVSEETPYRELVRTFRAEHPQVQITLVNEMDFMRTAPTNDGIMVRPLKLAELVKASGADCFEDAMGRNAEELASAALDLQPLIERDGMGLADFFDRTLTQVSVGGHLWGLPGGMKVPVLQYNATLFDAANAPYPSDGATWETLLSQARALASGAGAERRYGLVVWPGLQLVAQVQDLAGVSVIDAKSTPPTVRFNSAEVIAAAELLAGLVRDGIAPTVPDAKSGYATISELISSGRVAMWPAESGDFRNLRFELGIAPLPGSQPCCRLGSPCIVRTLHISNSTAQVQACWQWLRFLSEQPAADAFSIPPRRSVLASAAFRQQVGSETQAIYLAAAECEPDEPGAGWDALPKGASNTLSLLASTLEQIVWHGADAKSSLNQVQEKADAYVACLRRCVDAESDTCLNACAQ